MESFPICLNKQGSTEARFKEFLITMSLTHFESDDEMLFQDVYYRLPKGCSFLQECWSDLNMSVGPIAFGDKLPKLRVFAHSRLLEPYQNRTLPLTIASLFTSPFS